MTIILIIFCIWGASALVRMAIQQKNQRELERIKAEQRRARQAQSEQLSKQIEQEREMLRLRREQEKLEKEQEKQAALLAKHEQRLEQLELKVRKLDRDIQAQKELLGDYYGQLDWLQLQQSATVPGGKEFAKYQDKIVTKQNQIRKAENKLADMTETMEKAEREMEVA